ncbi:TrmB family transcriptional regulator [Natronorubrum daqingense]|uniref:Sugar-specific transcriptional regulator TrmB n=1 Tax=Natronorubrum daqingense TaxID=588898 RepID=A0A1N7C7J1_9EURY|nr:helix-turn-helix domain-containing protein [Natronorubrum daqingense]APX96776.1 TrmB family transcriptional regulator [Natronorubrum daqingense]SIR59540.1 Sugar-specific transcriptional regulator TrmB [Natronorubrum daqingense]
MTIDESEAIDAFERLGLTSYESKVFIALHQLGSGTARDVANTTDVPRSQVYSVAESLEERGLLEVQQSSPIRYRPVSIEEAQETLRNRFEREQERAFDYVDSVKQEPTTEETQEDIWTVRSRERINNRSVDLLSQAEERIIFGTRLPGFVTDAIEETIQERAAAGVSVIVISRTDDVRDMFEDTEGITTTLPPSRRASDDRSGRIVVIDDNSLLLSVVDNDGSETAIWSAGSLFADVLIQLLEAGDDIESSFP